MRLKESLALLLLITVSGVFGQDGVDPKSSTPAPTSTPAPIKCKTRDPVSPAPKEPEISDVFEMIAEVTQVEPKQETRIVKEYYDKTNNRGAQYTIKETEETRELYDYKNGYSFKAAMKDNQCTSKPLTDTPSNMFQFVDGGLQDFFDHAKAHNFTFAGRNLTRGIPCVQWSTCMEKKADDGDKDVVIDWHFSEASKANMPYVANDKSVPVKLEVLEYKKGESLTGNLTSHIMYDFISYKEEISDTSVFWPELGFLCGDQEYYGKKTSDAKPEIADSFSVDMEQIHTSGDKTSVTSGKYARDKENNLMRMDLEIIDSEDSHYKTKCVGTGTCTIIHDYTSGAEYVFDTKGTCKIYTIPKRPDDAVWDTDHLDKDNKTAYLLLATGMQLFQVNETTTRKYYQGPRKFRDVLTDAWVFTNTGKEGAAYREFLFKKETEDKKKVGALFGYLENGKTKDGKEAYNIGTNFYNYNSKAPDLSAFDVHDCFANATKDFKTIHARVDLTEKWSKVQTIPMVTLQPLVRKTLARLAGIAVLRITDMQIATKDGDHDDDSTVQVWFTILGPTPANGLYYSSDGKFKAEKSVDDAEKSLDDALDEKDQPVQRNTTDKDGLVKIKKDSLKADDDALKGDPRTSQQSNTSSGHSSTQMGVLAFFMLVLGAVLGIGVGWWMWKRRNRGVPYQIHH